MTDLLDFLRARLDDDGETLATLDSTALNGIESTAGSSIREYVERGRAEVEAKRAVLDEHYNINDGDCSTCVDGHWGYPSHGGSSPQSWPCRTVRLLALPHAEHPDYDDDWKPVSDPR